MPHRPAPSAKVIVAVGAENEYANVIGQIGGKYLQVSSVLNNPNTDPHVFESSPRTAQQVSAAQLIVQNGVGYDTFMNTIESASPNSGRKVIVVQHLLGLPTDTPNPHLWYNPRTMPAVATALATSLSELQPAHASYFHANATAFINSLKPWLADIAKVKAAFPGAPVATTEPVGDYMLQAAGTDDLTPWSFSADVMNGVDTTPQDNSFQENLFNQHKVKVFVYNQQVTNSITQILLSLAHKDDIPVVGVYETMPVPGYKYQTWMEAEATALYNALAHGTSWRSCSDEPGRRRPPGDVVALDRISVWLSGREVLHDVSFSVRPGEFTGIDRVERCGQDHDPEGDPRAPGADLRPGPHRMANLAPGATGRSAMSRRRSSSTPTCPVRARDVVGLGLDGYRFGLPHALERPAPEDRRDA